MAQIFVTKNKHISPWLLLLRPELIGWRYEFKVDGQALKVHDWDRDDFCPICRPISLVV